MFLLGILPQLIVDSGELNGSKLAGALEILAVLAWTIYLSFAGALLEALMLYGQGLARPMRGALAAATLLVD